MKAVADYDTTPGPFITSEDAAAAIEMAARLVECIRSVLAPDSDPT